MKILESEVRNLKFLEFFILGLFLLLITYTMFFGQRIPLGDGFGGDGTVIRDFIQHFGLYLKTRSFDFYMLQHFFPNAIFFVIAKILHIPLTNKNLLYSAYITNYVFIGISLVFFYLITQKLQLRPAVRILALVGLFLNFAMLKFSGYYVFLPDITAFCLTMILYYAYLNEYLILFLIIALAGSFTFPSFTLFGLFLFSFSPTEKIEKTSHKTYHLIAGLISILIVFSALLNGYYFITTHASNYPEIPHYLQYLLNQFSYFLNPMLHQLKIHHIYNIDDVLARVSPINDSLYLLSLFTLMLYVFFTQKTLWGNIAIFSIFKKLRLKLILLYITMIYGSLFLVRHFYCFHNNGFPTFDYFFTNSYTAIVYPFCFIVSHFIYYGPIILLFILFWNPFIAYIKTSSPGIILFASLGFISAIDSESRHLLNIIPILILILACAINQDENILKKLTLRFLVFFTLLSLLISCFWIRIRLPTSIDLSHPHILQTFPYQSYFMFQGPWMSNPMYYAFLTLFLISLGILAYYFQRIKKFTKSR